MLFAPAYLSLAIHGTCRENPARAPDVSLVSLYRIKRNKCPCNFVSLALRNSCFYYFVIDFVG